MVHEQFWACARLVGADLNLRFTTLKSTTAYARSHVTFCHLWKGRRKGMGQGGERSH